MVVQVSITCSGCFSCDGRTNIQLSFHPKKGMEQQAKSLIESYIRSMVSVLIPLLDASKTDIEAFLAVMKTNDHLATAILPRGILGSSGPVPNTGSTFQRQTKTEPRSFRCPRARRLIFSSQCSRDLTIRSQGRVVDDDNDNATPVNDCYTADASLSESHEQGLGHGHRQLNYNGNVHAFELLLRRNPSQCNEIERLPTLAVYDSRRFAQILEADY